MNDEEQTQEELALWLDHMHELGALTDASQAASTPILPPRVPGGPQPDAQDEFKRALARMSPETRKLYTRK